jgi:hypothetical protein
MKIQSGNQPIPGPPKPPKKELEVKPDLDNIADRYNGSRATGNYVSGMTLGALKEAVTTTVQSPRLAWEIAENLWQAETIGPNLKVLGTLAALPAAALSIPAGPFYGAFKGFTTVADAMRNRPESSDPLRPDTSPDFARSVFSSGDGTEANEPTTMTGHLCKSLEELGEAKLAEGEKPHDVPLLSPLFSVVGGAVSFVVSGAVGLVAGLVAGSITCAKEMGGAFTGDKTFGARVGQFCAAPLNVVAMPLALAWSGIKEATPRGFIDGWNHGPFKPVIDTAKVSAGITAGVIKEAWER